MRIDLKQLKQLQVETISGKELGSIVDIIFEIEGQLVAQYVVHPSMSIISRKEYLVSRDQVVRFEKEKLIVEDNVIKEKESETSVSFGGATPDPVMMMED